MNRSTGKRIASLAMILCLTASAAAGCGKEAKNDQSEAVGENATTGGKVLNIYGWNTECRERMTSFYPDYKDNDDDTGSIGDVKVVWHIIPSDNYEYQNQLDETLLVNMDKSADDRMDMFLLEADYILKYVDSDYTLDVVNDLGISESELADQYPYTKTIATSRDEKLKGVSWQATPGLFAYRRSIARDVLGTDDPQKVQQALADWDGFDHVADMAHKKGYKMISGPGDCFKVFSNNATTTWVDDATSSSPRIQIDPKLFEWAEMCKKYSKNDWMNGTKQWSDEWNFDQTAASKVFGFFLSTWGINYTLLGNAGDEGFGDWAVCEGPAAWYWGGTWIAAARGTDNKDIVADIMRKLTCDKENMIKITKEIQDYTNTISGMESIAKSDYKSDFLGGQNHIALFSSAAPKIDMTNAGPYDQGLNDSFQEAFDAYISGESDKNAALAEFYKEAVVKYPELTYTFVREE